MATGQEKKVKVSDLPESGSFGGLWTLGYKWMDGVKTSVKVSLQKIQEAYEDVLRATGLADAATTNANAATASAKQAAQDAVTATTDTRQAAAEALAAKTAADTATGNTLEAIRNAEAATASTRQAIEDAGTATALANQAAQDADTSREAIEADEAIRQSQEQARQDNTATAISNAEKATAAANKAKQDADAATSLANQAAQNADTSREAIEANEAIRQSQEQDRQTNTATAISNAEKATAAANKAKTDADAATAAANTAAQNADTARTEIEANESTRQSQEQARQDSTATAIWYAETATAKALAARERADAAADLATELNDHPMKIQGGVWYKWDTDQDAYVNTGIQAKGDTGSSFKIIGQYGTEAELKAAVPDGTDVDGVFAVGASDPFSYYAWVYADGAWQWQNQGQLRGPEGKSAYEVWISNPDHADDTVEDWIAWLQKPATDAAADARTAISDAQAATTAANTAATNADNSRMQLEADEATRQSNETTRQKQEAKRQNDTAAAISGIQSDAATAITNVNKASTDAISAMQTATNTAVSNAESATDSANTAAGEALKAAGIALDASASMIIPDIDHEPGEDDLAYTRNGKTYNYRVGGECRYFDPGMGEYVFYKLHDITDEGKAVWQEAGSGGGFKGETVVLTVKSTVGDNDMNLVGIVLTVKIGLEETMKPIGGVPLTLQVPSGKECTITPPAVAGYRTPQPVSFIAEAGGEREASFLYEAINHVSFDTLDNVPENIRVTDTGGVIASLCDEASMRYLVKLTGQGKKATLLDASDSSKYADGQPAALDGTEGDMMTRLPGMYYSIHRDTEGIRRISVAKENIGGGMKPFAGGWVGAMKASVASGKMRSVAGVAPTLGMSYAEYKAAASARGMGYEMVGYDQHCQIAFLLYARYKTRDLQRALGKGGAHYNAGNLTGQTIRYGNHDTTAREDGYVSGLGLEGVFGCCYEYMARAYKLGADYHLQDPDGTERVYSPGAEVHGWVSHMLFEDTGTFDLVPTGCDSSGSSGYTDFFEAAYSDFLPLYPARSCYSVEGSPYQDDGIAYLQFLNTEHLTNGRYGTRLAYRGDDVQVVDAETYRSLETI